MSRSLRLAIVSAAIFTLASVKGVNASDNGLSITPAMGWNTWNSFGCDISEDTILTAAQAIKSYKLDEYGYNYINVDDCWQAPARAANGTPVADPEKFPMGIKDLADRVNAMGLKLGIYSSAGKYTCGGRFGSLGYEEVDAQAYASWGVEYLKYDNCFNEGQSGTPLISATRYQKMADALNATGKPILYSLCSWGEDFVWNWGSTVGNSWRISGDIYDNFDRFDDRCPCLDSVELCPLAGFRCSLMNIIEKAAGLGQKARSGAWNDLDMLEVGNGGMTHTEYVTHFSVWAFVKSPLILGNALAQVSNETLSIITNRHIIALNQDENYSAGYRIWKKNVTSEGSLQLWKTNLANGTYGLLLLNAGPDKQTVTASMADFFIDEGPSYLSRTWAFYDLWDDASLYSTLEGSKSGGQLQAEVESHGVRVFKVVERTGESRRRLEL